MIPCWPSWWRKMPFVPAHFRPPLSPNLIARLTAWLLKLLLGPVWPKSVDLSLYWPNVLMSGSRSTRTRGSRVDCGFPVLHSAFATTNALLTGLCALELWGCVRRTGERIADEPQCSTFDATVAFVGKDPGTHSYYSQLAACPLCLRSVRKQHFRSQALS